MARLDPRSPRRDSPPRWSGPSEPGRRPPAPLCPPDACLPDCLPACPTVWLSAGAETRPPPPRPAPRHASGAASVRGTRRGAGAGGPRRRLAALDSLRAAAAAADPLPPRRPGSGGSPRAAGGHRRRSYGAGRPARRRSVGAPGAAGREPGPRALGVGLGLRPRRSASGPASLRPTRSGGTGLPPACPPGAALLSRPSLPRKARDSQRPRQAPGCSPRIATVGGLNPWKPH